MSKSRKLSADLAKPSKRRKLPRRNSSAAAGRTETPSQTQVTPIAYMAGLVEDAMAMREALAADRERLTAEVAQLKSVLEATRKHAFATQSAVIGSQQVARGSHQVVVWGVEQSHRTVIDTLLASLPRTAVTVVLKPGTDPTLFVRGHEAGYSVMAAHDDAPASYWNQAFACTQTATLVFLHIGSAPAGECATQLACAAMEQAVALSTPAVLGRTTRTLGLAEQGRMELAPVASEERRLVQTVAHGSAMAFAMTRAAYHAVGCFDETLRTGLSLADWTMRSRALAMRVLGVSSATVSTHPAIGISEIESSESDRLILLARYQPEQLAASLLTMPGVFQQPPERVAATLRAVFSRLPNASEFPAAAELLAGQATAMAATLRSLPGLVAEVCGLAELLGVTVAADQTAEQVAVAVRAAVVQQLEHVELLQNEVQELPLVRTQLASSLEEISGLKDRLLANADALRGVEQVRAERDVAIASLRTELEQARATIGRLEGELRAAEAAHELIPRLQVLVEQSNERVVALEAELATRSSTIAEREVAIGRLRGTAEALQEQVARITSERDSLRGTVRAGS